MTLRKVIKLFAILLLPVFFIALSGCGDDEGMGNDSDDTAVEENNGSDSEQDSSSDNGSGNNGTDTSLNLALGQITSDAFEEGVVYSPGRSLQEVSLYPYEQVQLVIDLVEQSGSLQKFRQAVELEFISQCAANARATFSKEDSLVWTQVGRAEIGYTPLAGCIKDRIQVVGEWEGQQLHAEVFVEVANQKAESISFVYLDESDQTPFDYLLRLDHSHSNPRLPPARSLVFQLHDIDGRPLGAGEVVDFTLVSMQGKKTVSASLEREEGVTNAEGKVSVSLRSGEKSELFRVKASTGSAWTKSPEYRVTSGLPYQNNFHLTAAVDVDTTPFSEPRYEIRALVGDRFNNPVPNGTQVFFISEFGLIDESCETLDGVCEVSWMGVLPEALRSADLDDEDLDVASLDFEGFNSTNTDQNRQSRDSEDECEANAIARFEQGLVSQGFLKCDEPDAAYRSTVLAFTQGEESFLDNDSSMVFDNAGYEKNEEAKSWFALGKLFLDSNETGVYNSDTHYSDLWVDWVEAAEPSEFYRGVSCSAEARIAGHCSELAQVRRSLVLDLYKNWEDFGSNLLAESIPKGEVERCQNESETAQEYEQCLASVLN